MVAKLINRGNGAGLTEGDCKGERVGGDTWQRGMVKLQNGAFSFTSALVLVSVGKHD